MLCIIKTMFQDLILQGKGFIYIDDNTFSPNYVKALSCWLLVLIYKYII